MKNKTEVPANVATGKESAIAATTIPDSMAPIKKKLEKYSKKNPWLVPAGIAFAFGLGVAIAGNLLFSSQFETIGIVVGSVLLVFFLALLGLLFFVLHQIQQRARWENDNFQLAIKAELESRRSEQQSEESRKRQEATILMALITRTAPDPDADAPIDSRIVAAVQNAMSLAADGTKSLADKFEALQSAVNEIQNVSNR